MKKKRVWKKEKDTYVELKEGLRTQGKEEMEMEDLIVQGERSNLEELDIIEKTLEQIEIAGSKTNIGTTKDMGKGKRKDTTDRKNTETIDSINRDGQQMEIKDNWGEETPTLIKPHQMRSRMDTPIQWPQTKNRSHQEEEEGMSVGEDPVDGKELVMYFLQYKMAIDTPLDRQSLRKQRSKRI